MDINFSDFSDASGLFNLNGDAVLGNNLLSLTPDAYNKKGSAFYNQSLDIDLDTSFQTQFEFRLHGGQGTNGADGFTFMLQNSPTGAEALGGGGGGLGYSGISKSLAVEFDTYTNRDELTNNNLTNNNHISVLRDGNVSQALKIQPNLSSIDLNNNKSTPINAWIDYNGKTNNLEVFLSENANKPSSALMSYTVDLASVLGSKAFVGFSAGTGGAYNAQDIQSWKFSSSNNSGTGTGLKGEYYDNIDFTNLKLTRTDATVNFGWATGSPDPSIGADTFSVRWTGKVQALASEAYTFYVTGDDGVRLRVNNQQVIDGFKNQAPTEYTSTPVTLQAGQQYDIRLDYYENGGGAVAKLGWSSASQSKEIIPQSQLYATTTAPSQDINYAITTSNATLTEGNSGTKPVTFTVTRSGATKNASSVNYSIGGSATNGSDYNSIGGTSGAIGLTGTINFADNEASKTITLNVLGDTTVEQNETVQITLSNGTALNGIATLVTPIATTTINNDDSAGIKFSTTRVASGLANPLFATAPTGDFNRLFVVEQKSGKIKILDLQTNTFLSDPFLTLPAQELLKTSYEQGLLGLAFHPNYATNGKFYVSYTAPFGGPAGQTKVVEYRVSNNPNIADQATARTILTIDQPEVNHNGGWLSFGKDGFLYWASGDGGGNGYQQGNQDLSNNSQVITNNLLGKILRIDINGDAFLDDPNRNYAIPTSNPFVNKTGDDEIWAYGLRNPWRPTFDRVTGDLYIADVGQNKWEEINFQSASSQGGENYGWNLFEGDASYIAGSSSAGLTFPIYQYSHSVGKSVTGGYVYRGPASELNGTYFFGDFSSGKIWSFKYLNNTISQFTDRTAEFTPPTGQGAINSISSFGEDAAGNLYVVDWDGEIFRLNVT